MRARQARAHAAQAGAAQGPLLRTSDGARRQPAWRVGASRRQGAKGQGRRGQGARTAPAQRSTRMRHCSSRQRTWRGERAWRGRMRQGVASTRRRTTRKPRTGAARACSLEVWRDRTAGAGERGTSGRRARTPCRGQVRECVGDAQGASAHRVNEAPEDDDAKDRSFKAGIYVRAVGCARTPRCG